MALAIVSTVNAMITIGPRVCRGAGGSGRLGLRFWTRVRRLPDIVAEANMTAQADRTRRPFVTEEAVAILARTPASLDALLRGLPDGWIVAHEGGDTWSPFDVVGHLIHGERTDWVPRARIILEHGEARVFDPFDRFAQFAVSEG